MVHAACNIQDGSRAIIRKIVGLTKNLSLTGCTCQREHVWTIDLHVIRCVLEGVAVRVAMIDESCSILARLRSALVSRRAVLPVGAMCTIPVVSTLDVVDVVQRASPHGSHTTCIMLTSISVNAVECYPATVLSSVHPIPIRSLACANNNFGVAFCTRSSLLQFRTSNKPITDRSNSYMSCIYNWWPL